MGRSLSSSEPTSNSCSEEPKKRRKEDDDAGTDEDWEYLLSKLQPNFLKDATNVIPHNDLNAPLFSKIPTIFYTLHLLYEDLKLDATMHGYLKFLVEVN